MVTGSTPNLIALGMVWAGVGVWSLPIRDVLIYSEGSDVPVARAGLTYSIPPKRAE